MGEQRQLLRADVTMLSKQHRRWLKRLATGKIPDAEWPLGFNSRAARCRCRDQLMGGPNALCTFIGK